jgi:hypothetical protein
VRFDVSSSYHGYRLSGSNLKSHRECPRYHHTCCCHLIAAISCEEDTITFDTQNLILRETQTTGDYNGVCTSFSAHLFTTKMPILIDIGFNDIIIPSPQKIQYPTLLDMPAPTLLGYTIETVIAEKLESIVKLSLVNTRIKDFYDLHTLLTTYEINHENLLIAIRKVFANRETILQYPTAFSPLFYETLETQKRWRTFLSSIGVKHIEFKEIIEKLALFFEFLKASDKK